MVDALQERDMDTQFVQKFQTRAAVLWQRVSLDRRTREVCQNGGSEALIDTFPHE